tara:strand:+ start:2634 stop:3407 length:774 start_codon:yes stop_codon:yes gene_type:complete
MTLRQRFKDLKENIFFEFFVIFVIVVSGITIGLKTFDDIPLTIIDVINKLDYGITIFFLVEILIRIFSEEKKINFFKSGWNVFDFTIILLSAIPSSLFESILILRILRLIRVLRLITFVPQFKVIIQSLFVAIPRVFYVLLFMLINFYIFAVAGVTFFAELDSKSWGNIGLAMLTLFQVATLEGWPDLLSNAMDYNGYSWIFFVSFIIINALIFMNMIIGVIIDVVVRENDEGLPENIALLHSIKEDIETIKKKINL